MYIDYLIVGSGLTGATIARLLSDAGRDVLVLERRNHLGGNVYDHSHPSGIHIHTYGPHYFRTDSVKIWHFVNRFADWYRFEAVVKSLVDGRYENWPVAGNYIRQAVGKQWQPGFIATPTNFEEASLAMMPEIIYHRFVKGYSEKQWGVPATSLSASLAKRFDASWNDDPRLKHHRYQGLPVQGYNGFMSRLLEGIPVIVNCDYLKCRDSFQVRKLLIYTGPIDEFFEFALGKLKYRSQYREHIYLPDTDWSLPCGQVNIPDPNTLHVRSLEWKHMMQPAYAMRIKGTVLTNETPFTPTNPDQYEYPFPDEANARLYKHYTQLAHALGKLVVCGRLGDYRYYDMDHAISRAMAVANRILEM